VNSDVTSTLSIEEVLNLVWEHNKSSGALDLM
jgi:hypothetical protein